MLALSKSLPSSWFRTCGSKVPTPFQFYARWHYCMLHSDANPSGNLKPSHICRESPVGYSEPGSSQMQFPLFPHVLDAELLPMTTAPPHYCLVRLPCDLAIDLKQCLKGEDRTRVHGLGFFRQEHHQSQII